MQLIGSINIPQEGQNGTLEFNKFIPDNVQADGIRIRCKGPLKNLGGAGYTPDATDLLNWIKHVLSSVLFTYGDNDSRVILAALRGDVLRTAYRFVEEEEFPTDVISGGAIGAGLTVTRTFSLFLPFASSKHPGSIFGRVGSTQLKTMKLTVAEDGNKTIKAAQLERGAGNVTIDVIPNWRPGPDTWAPPLTIGTTNLAELEVEIEDGLTVAAWDENAAEGATALTRFDCHVSGELEHRQLEPVLVGDEYARQLDQGGADITDTVTLLLFASKYVALEKAALGRPKFRQNTQELASWKVRQLYFPVLTDEEMAEAAITKAKRIKAPVLASRVELPADAHPGAAACAPVRLFTQDNPEFYLRAGVLGSEDGSFRAVVPESIQKAAQALVGSASDRMERDAMGRKLQKAVARQVGAVNTRGSKAGAHKRSVMETLRSLF